MNQAFPSDDGNFKRGAFKPIAILVALLLVAGGAIFAFMGSHAESQTLTKDEVNKEILGIQLLPRAEQIPRWRKWAEVDTEPHLQQEAFVHLAWAKDKASIPAVTKGLSSIDHAVRGTAAMALVDFGSPDADSAKPSLLKALGEAGSGDKPQICWALVALKESRARSTMSWPSIDSDTWRRSRASTGIPRSTRSAWRASYRSTPLSHWSATRAKAFASSWRRRSREPAMLAGRTLSSSSCRTNRSRSREKRRSAWGRSETRGRRNRSWMR